MHANYYGSGNIAIGHQALFANTGGNDNVAIGPSSLKDNKGGRNTAMGINSLLKNTTGNYNTAIGFWALSETTSSEENTAVGYQAGKNFNNGYNNVFVGANVDVDAGYYNVVAIGQGTVVDAVNRVRIGNTATMSYGGWAGWTNLSDGRYKSDIQENVPGLDFILKLRPVTYHLQASALSLTLGENHGEEWSDQMKFALADKQKILQTGFIAQEVESVAQSIGYDFSGVDRPGDEQGIYGLRYAEFVMSFVKAVQELKDENERLREDNHLLRKTDDLLVRRLSQIETALGLAQELAASPKE
ncbi:MAG: tail fiber domain-containing protein [Saprospiraceae bacterium]|nr:tail fiber domain-containing protein [Saprospiraceae bacterium]